MAAYEDISQQVPLPGTPTPPAPMDTTPSLSTSGPSTPSTSDGINLQQQENPDDPGSDIDIDQPPTHNEDQDHVIFSGGEESDYFDMSFDNDDNDTTSTSGISRSGSSISNISQATTSSQQSSASGTSHTADHNNNNLLNESISEQAESLFPIKHLDDSVFTQLTEFTPHQRFEHELTLYLKKDVVVQADPHLWWNNNKIELPRLALLANKYLSCPPSSIESERTFSLGGCTYRPKRSKLLPETGGKLIELGFNMRHFSDIWEDK